MSPKKKFGDIDKVLFCWKMSRFPVITEEERAKIISDKAAKNTNKATNVAWNAFNCWLAARHIQIDPSSIPRGELDEVLA